MLTKTDTFRFADDVPSWLFKNYQLFLVPGLVYPVAVQYLQGCFQYDLKIPLFMWNCLLSLYSGVSLYVITPPFVGRIQKYGYHESVCLANHKDESYLYQPWGWWIYLFILSKIVELGDTAFLILRGRKVNFLHWYHHLATLTAGYVQSYLLMETMEWATWMNLLVHTWMYGHYALSTYYKKLRGNMVLTSLQILQMVHGLFMCVYHSMYCNSIKDVPSIAVYTIYAALFLSFFKNKYFTKIKNS